jgi:hypothetical protein
MEQAVKMARKTNEGESKSIMIPHSAEEQVRARTVARG